MHADSCFIAGSDRIHTFVPARCTMRYETNVANGVTGVEFDRMDIEMNKFAVQ